MHRGGVVPVHRGAGCRPGRRAGSSAPCSATRVRLREGDPRHDAGRRLPDPARGRSPSSALARSAQRRASGCWSPSAPSTSASTASSGPRTTSTASRPSSTSRPWWAWGRLRRARAARRRRSDRRPRRLARGRRARHGRRALVHRRGDGVHARRRRARRLPRRLERSRPAPLRSKRPLPPAGRCSPRSGRDRVRARRSSPRTRPGSRFTASIARPCSSPTTWTRDEWLPFVEARGAAAVLLHVHSWPRAYREGLDAFRSALRGAGWRRTLAEGEMELWLRAARVPVPGVG